MDDAMQWVRGAVFCAVLLGGLGVASARAAAAKDICAALRASPRDGALLQQLRQSVSDAPDDPRQNAYMAAYSLGCLHAGMTGEGQRTRTFLLSRLGSDPAVAHLASDRLDVRCSACAAASGASACSVCGGTGKVPSPAAVEREYLALLDELSGHAEAAVQAPHAETPTPAPAWGSMQEFVKVMQDLREQSRDGRAEAVDLETVIAHPEAYTGRAVRCSGFVVGYHPKQITVSPDADLSTRQRIDLTPDSLYVGTRVGTAFRSSGRPVPVDVVFALINGSRNVAFAVDPVVQPAK